MLVYKDITSLLGYGCEKMGGDSHWEIEYTRVVCHPLENFYCYYSPGYCKTIEKTTID